MAEQQHYTGVADCMRKMYRTEGILSFWKGILPPILVETPKRAWKFLTFEQFKTVFNFNGKDAPPTPLVSLNTYHLIRGAVFFGAQHLNLCWGISSSKPWLCTGNSS